MMPGGGWREPYSPDDYDDLSDDPIDNPVEDPLDGQTGRQILIVLGIAAVALVVLLLVLRLAGVQL